MTNVTDLIDGGSFDIDADGNRTVRRVFYVDGLSGAKESRGLEAAQSGDVPRHGDEHPTISGLFARIINVEPLSATQARVTVTYKGLDFGRRITTEEEGAPGTIQITASVVPTVTQKDNKGEQLLVEHEGIRQGGEVEIQVPQLVLSRVRIESAAPTKKALEFVGTVNRFSTWGFAARTLLCTRLQGVSSDGGESYEVTYEFQYNRGSNGWDAEYAFIDPETSKPPPDLTEGIGVKSSRVYPETDFNRIGIFF